MILLLNGCINSGKSSVANALSRLVPDTAHVELDELDELDELRQFCSWLPLEAAVSVTLAAARVLASVSGLESSVSIELSDGQVQMGNPWVGKRMGAAAVILNASKQVLLVKHSYGRLNWELPGGAAEAGESVADAAVRNSALALRLQNF